MTLAAAKREYKQLIGSWEYAFAMGHGCSMGAQPGAQAIRDRADRLHRTIRVMEAQPLPDPPYKVSMC